MVKVREFKKEDLKTVNHWLDCRKLPSIDMMHLPNLGYICDNVAVGFIYLTDSTVAILDCFVASPHANKEEIDEALNLIVIHLLSHARLCGVTLVTCTTKSKSIKTRAEKFGFKKTGECIELSKELH